MFSASNDFLEYILKGEFTIGLPHYARKENYEAIKYNIDKLIVFEGFAEDVFKKYRGFNKFNLSNIFEYMSQKEFEAISENMAENSVENSTFCYWNLMVERKMSEEENEFTYDKTNSKKWTVKDKGFFYKNFIIETK